MEEIVEEPKKKIKEFLDRGGDRDVH